MASGLEPVHTDRIELLSMPDEILEKILAYTLLASDFREFQPHFLPRTAMPDIALKKKLRMLAACRKIYYIAKGCYFRDNWLQMQLCMDWNAERGRFPSIVSGTFENTRFFLDRVQKLRAKVSIREFEDPRYLARKVYGIIAGCTNLKKTGARSYREQTFKLDRCAVRR